MATLVTKQRDAAALLKKQVADPQWGRKLCDPKWQCTFCKQYGDNPDLILEFRNQYVTGLPIDVVMFMVDPECSLSCTDFHHHAYRAQWSGRRKRVLEIAVDPAFAFVQVMRRLQKANNVISDQSGDKMIQHIVEMAGISKKVQVKQDVTFTWETTVNKAASEKDGDAIFTLDDADFADVTEAFEEVTENAETS